MKKILLGLLLIANVAFAGLNYQPPLTSTVEASTTNAQSIPSGAYTTVTTYATTQNVGSNFVAATGVYTVPVTGTYAVGGGARLASAAWILSGQMLCGVNVNGTVVGQGSGIATSAAATTIASCSVEKTVTATAGQTIVFQVFQNSGGAIALDTSSTANWISIKQML